MDGEQTVDACSIAQKKSIETALGYCESEQARLELAGRLAGVGEGDMKTSRVGEPADAIDPTNHKAQRVWVAHKTYEYIESGKSPFDALDAAWGDLDNEMANVALDEMAEDETADEDEPLDLEDEPGGLEDEPLDLDDGGGDEPLEDILEDE